MTWLNTPPGDGWKLAGPNAPLDGTILFIFFYILQFHVC